MDARAQSALLLAIVAAALATAMLLRSSRPRPFVLFALLNADVAAWGASRFLSSVLQSSWPVRLESAAAMLLPAAVLAFLLEFLGQGSAAARRTLRTLTIVGTTGAVAALTQLSTLKPESWSIAPLRLSAAVWAFAGLHGCVLLLHGRMRSAPSRTERARLLYLVVGAALALGLTLVDLVARDIAFPPLGTVATTAYLYFLSQTLLRHRLLDLNELLGKFVVLSLLALLLALIYGLLVSWSVGLTPDASGWTGLFLFNTLIASFVILILFEPLRAKIEGAVVTLLFRERRALLETLLRLRRRLSTLIDVDEAVRLLLDGLEESRRVTHASVYLLSDDGLGFHRVDARGPAPAAHLDASTARGLLAAVAQGERAVLQETVERRLFELRSQTPGASTNTRPPAPASTVATGDEALQLADLGAALAAMKATVCVPLLGGERVLGFLALDDDRVQEAFASDELAAMLELAAQLAVVVDNSRLYERMKERDRLAALGEMAAGLAHEIRNPLSSIKGAVQLLEPTTGHGGDDELVGIILDEVSRLDTVVRQFLDYARPLRLQAQSADVNEIVRRTLKLLKTRETPGAVDIAEQLDEALGPVACDPDQLRQVLLNLALNAVQAMDGRGTLTVRTSRPRQREARVTSGAPDGVELRVSDTGPGMTEEVRSRLFIPFFTTKQKGTGLGLAICQRIVKAHGGSIRVESRPGEGTTFVIRLPGQTERATLDLTPAPVPRPVDLPTLPPGRRPA